MAPIHTKQMPDLSDELRRDLESIYTPDIEAQFLALDKNGPIEQSSSDDTTYRVVDSDTALGEPVKQSELISKEAHAAVVEVVKNQSDVATIKVISSRLNAFRERFASK